MSQPGVTRGLGGRMWLWGSWERAWAALGGLVCAGHGAVRLPPCSTLKPPTPKTQCEAASAPWGFAGPPSPRVSSAPWPHPIMHFQPRGRPQPPPQTMVPPVPPSPTFPTPLMYPSPSCREQSHPTLSGRGSRAARITLGAQPRAGWGQQRQVGITPGRSPTAGPVPQFPSMPEGEQQAGSGAQAPPTSFNARWQHLPSTGRQEKGIIFSLVSQEMRLQQWLRVSVCEPPSSSSPCRVLAAQLWWGGGVPEGWDFCLGVPGMPWVPGNVLGVLGVQPGPCRGAMT